MRGCKLGGDANSMAGATWRLKRARGLPKIFCHCKGTPTICLVRVISKVYSR